MQLNEEILGLDHLKHRVDQSFFVRPQSHVLPNGLLVPPYVRCPMQSASQELNMFGHLVDDVWHKQAAQRLEWHVQSHPLAIVPEKRSSVRPSEREATVRRRRL